MLLMIDNYDSFTYNLVQYFGELGQDVRVFRNDAIKLDEIERLNPDYLVISPGPCTPAQAGISLAAIRAFAGKIPLLGVCLGHQAIGEVFGAKLENLAEVYHGVATDCEHFSNDPIFNGMPRHFEVGRYHSWVVSKDGLPDCLEVTATSPDGNIMALRHKRYPVHGIQFHPESVLTPLGKQIVGNWLNE